MSGRGGLRVKTDEDDGWGGIGGYMGAKNRKLEQQYEEDAVARGQSSSIFCGVAIHCDGWTTPSHDELKLIMMKNGGKYHMYYSRLRTTHVIASNLPHAKRKELRPNQKVVKPEWVTDSLKAKELLPIEKYLVVPVEDSAQRRITSILGKTGQACSSSNLTATTSSECNEMPNSSSEVSESRGKAPGSRTICPTTDSNFLSEFYSHSRLHFLSTWKMELKEYVRSLQSEESLVEIPLSGYERLLQIAKSEGLQPKNNGRVVIHIDMDCFFVSVGLKSRPELKGLPVAVTHSTGTGMANERPDADPGFEAAYYKKKYGDDSKLSEETSNRALSSSSFGPGYSAAEIASCSYEARAFGVKNGMFMGKAKQLCPDLRVIPYDFKAYRQTSDLLYNTLASFTRHIEAVSCDEALVDISKVVKETGLDPIRVASCIRNAVKNTTECNASTGVGPNIALARMATRRAKPDGEYAVTQEEARDFMKTLSLKDLPGVGRSTAFRLQEMGLSTCGDLQDYSIATLKQEFGTKTGQKLQDMSCGIDNREVEIEKERKSVSAEVNYGIRLSTNDEAKDFLQNLSKEVINRLKSIGMRGRRITLKLMVRRQDAPLEATKYGGHGVCDSLSRSSLITLRNNGDPYEQDCASIHEAAWTILSSLTINVSDLRGIGIQVTQLHPFSSSSKPESSSAAFLKKFMVKKSLQPLPTTEPEEGKSNMGEEASTSADQPTTSNFLSSHLEKIEVVPDPDGDAMNLSFLNALPPDLRKEVEQNLAGQKEALERNFLNNENSNDSVGSGFAAIDDENSRGSTTSNVLFCEQGKLSTGSRQKLSNAKAKPKKGQKPKPSKTSTSRTSRKNKSSDVSPNKLITDMFPVTYSPNKPSSSKNSPANRKRASPTRTHARNRLNKEGDKVRRKLIPISEENELIEIIESDETDNNPQISGRPQPQEEFDDAPKLGGAFRIEEIRQVLSEWISAFTESGPLDCDVDDFICFLTRTAAGLRDLEKVHLTLRSLRRKLNAVLQQTPSSNESHRDWSAAYSKICDGVQSGIKNAYRGGELDILPL